MKETKVQLTGGRNVASWGLTVSFVIAYICVYVWFVTIAGTAGSTANWLLMGLMLAGIPLSWFVVDERIYRHHRSGDIEVLRAVFWLSIPILGFLAIWHFVGALMPSLGEQHVFAYGPGIVIIVGLIVLAIWAMSEGKYHNNGGTGEMVKPVDAPLRK